MCVKETSPRDVSFTHTNHMFNRNKIDNNHFGRVIYSNVYPPIIRTFDTSKCLSRHDHSCLHKTSNQTKNYVGSMMRKLKDKFVCQNLGPMVQVSLHICKVSLRSRLLKPTHCMEVVEGPQKLKAQPLAYNFSCLSYMSMKSFVLVTILLEYHKILLLIALVSRKPQANLGISGILF